MVGGYPSVKMGKPSQIGISQNNKNKLVREVLGPPDFLLYGAQGAHMGPIWAPWAHIGPIWAPWAPYNKTNGVPKTSLTSLFIILGKSLFDWACPS